MTDTRHIIRRILEEEEEEEERSSGVEMGDREKNPSRRKLPVAVGAIREIAMPLRALFRDIGPKAQ